MRIWSRDWASAGAATSAAAVSAAPARVRDFMRFSFRNSRDAQAGGAAMARLPHAWNIGRAPDTYASVPRPFCDGASHGRRG